MSEVHLGDAIVSELPNGSTEPVVAPEEPVKGSTSSLPGSALELSDANKAGAASSSSSDSSDDEGDGEESSDDSSSSSSSSIEELVPKPAAKRAGQNGPGRPQQRAKRKNDGDIDDGDDTDNGPPKSVHEADPKAGEVDIELAEDEEIQILGKITHIVGDMIVIKALHAGASGNQILNLDSIVCFEDRVVIGLIHEALGPVAEPFYSVLLPTNNPTKAVENGESVANTTQHTLETEKPAETAENKVEPVVQEETSLPTAPAPSTEAAIDPPSATVEVAAMSVAIKQETPAEPAPVPSEPSQAAVAEAPAEGPVTTVSPKVEENTTTGTVKLKQNMMLVSYALEDGELAPEVPANFGAFIGAPREEPTAPTAPIRREGVRYIPRASLEELRNRLKQGMEVYFASKHTAFVATSQLYVKGYDASNEFDEEIPAEQQEFSDDDEERVAKKRKRNKGGDDDEEDAEREAAQRAMDEVEDPDGVHTESGPKRQKASEARHRPGGGRGRGRGGQLTPPYPQVQPVYPYPMPFAPGFAPAFQAQFQQTMYGYPGYMGYPGYPPYPGMYGYPPPMPGGYPHPTPYPQPPMPDQSKPGPK